MEVRQYMTPEGLLEFVLQDGILVCEELMNFQTPVTHAEKLLLLSSEPSHQTDDQLRSRTHKVVRALSASCSEKS